MEESVGLGQPSGRHCDGILPLTRSVSIPGPAEVSHRASEGLALVDAEPALVTDSGQCREIKGLLNDMEPELKTMYKLELRGLTFTHGG